MQQSTMRKSRLFRWIEEAEARQVVILALSEASPSSDSQRPPAPARRMRLRLRGFARPQAALAADDAAPTVVVKPLPR